MELDCVLFDDSVKVIFDKVDETLGFVKILVIRENDRVMYSVTKYGQWDWLPYHKCVIFPKGKTTWDGFVPPCKFKDGDILFVKSVYSWIIIYKESEDEEKLHKYVAISGSQNPTNIIYDNPLSPLCYKEEIFKIRFATEEEKDKLFNVIKGKGYRWNEETKTLDKLLEPKFHKGDWITSEELNTAKILSINVDKYEVEFIDGNKGFPHIDYVDRKFHLWTIQDAKDGDVLTINWYGGYNYWEKIVIFKKYHNKDVDGHVEGYGNTFKNGKLAFNEEVPYYSKTWTRNLRPANKEQRELLFQKIKEAGYRWNEETKALEELAEPKFKDGDILYCDANDYGENDDDFKYIFIFDKLEDGKDYYSHCHLGGSEFYDEKTFLVNDYPVRFATEEEKQKLFQAIKDNGYTWNAETKTLEELAESKFKPGDVLVSESGNLVLLSHIDSENIVHYHCIIPTYGSFRIEENTAIGVGKCYDCVLANEQQRQRMYDKIQSSGYEYNQSTNKLEKVDEPEFKDGDIVFSGKDLISIFKKLSPSKSLHSYVSMRHNGSVYVDGDCWTSDNMRLATEEEKEKLFKAISEEGYKWDPDTKTLLTVPIFKPGDRIKRKGTPAVHAIKMVEKDLYVFDDLRSIPISVQGDYELVPKKFDINTLKPFDKVLVRNTNNGSWRGQFYMSYDKNEEYPFECTYNCWMQCIPYEGNEHLLCTTDDCDDYYKTW